MTIIQKSTFYLFIMLTTALLFLLIYFFGFSNFHRTEILVIVTFVINIILSLIFLVFSDKTSYSFNKVFWVFNLVFLCTLPLLQFIFNRQPWLGMTGEFSDNIYFYANILILFWFVSYVVARQYIKKVFIDIKRFVRK